MSFNVFGDFCVLVLCIQLFIIVRYFIVKKKRKKKSATNTFMISWPTFCSITPPSELMWCGTAYRHIEHYHFLLFVIFKVHFYFLTSQDSYKYIVLYFFNVNVICIYKVWWYLYRYEEWNNKKKKENECDFSLVSWRSLFFASVNC